MAKEFLTFDQLVALLNSRNVITDDSTQLQIMRESYYAIVNGYKEPFLDEKAMKSTSDDVYRPGTRFKWMYTLFSFDRDLRFITFKYLTKAEATMKNAVVYAFCNEYPDPNAYLERSSYVEPKDMLMPKGFRGDKSRIHQKNITGLMRILNAKVGNKNKPFTKHYIDAYGFVPLWVLQNDLTFGNISNFYQLLKRGVQNKACKLILEAIGSPSSRKLTPDQLLRAFSVLVDFRNICAHDERLYCAKVGKSHDIDFSQMAIHLSRVLPENEFDQFLAEIFALFNEYSENLHGVTPESLLNEMGFTIKAR